jgi:uncharacterized protein
MDYKDFTDKTIKILKEAKIPLSLTEILEIIQQKFRDKKVINLINYDWKEIVDYLNDESEMKKAGIKKISEKPDRFLMNDFLNEELPDRTTVLESELSLKQKDIRTNINPDIIPHFLSYYMGQYLNVYTKSITKKDDDTSNYIRWLHPSMIGVHFRRDLSDYEDEESVGNIRNITDYIDVYSFEIIKKLGFYNLKESYFQTISTSYWANQSYMVCVEIEDENDESFQKDLLNLGKNYGIGLIKLNIINPDASIIIVPARIKKDIDWEMTDKLSEENVKFKNLFNNIIKNYKSDELKKEHFDEIKTKNELFLMLEE